MLHKPAAHVIKKSYFLYLYYCRIVMFLKGLGKVRQIFSRFRLSFYRCLIFVTGFLRGDIMSKKRVIAEEVFAAMLDEAIEDLKQSGLDAGEVFSIVEENFGVSYARRFCSQ